MNSRLGAQRAKVESSGVSPQTVRTGLVECGLFECGQEIPHCPPRNGLTGVCKGTSARRTVGQADVLHMPADVIQIIYILILEFLCQEITCGIARDSQNQESTMHR